MPDYEGAIPILINEVLSRCGNIKVMSSIHLTSSFCRYHSLRKVEITPILLQQEMLQIYHNNVWTEEQLSKFSKRTGQGIGGRSKAIQSNLCG